MAYDVTLQAKLNGGGPLTGDIYGNLGDVVQLTAANKTNWPSSPAPVWQIYDYPDSFALPAGWTNSGDDTNKPSFTTLGVADPTTFAMTPWGRYKTRLIVAGITVDERTFLKVVSPSGLEDMARGEGAQFGGLKEQWTRAYNANLRIIEAVAARTTPTLQTWAAGRVHLLIGGATLTKGSNVASVVRNSIGNVTVTLTNAAVDANYAVVVSPRGTTGGMCIANTEATGSFVVERSDIGGALVDADFSFVLVLAK